MARTLLVTAIILAIIGYRVAKIIERQAQRAQAAESVNARVVWNIEIPDSEFLGDLTQSGNWFFYAVQDDQRPGKLYHFARNLGQGSTQHIAKSRPNPTRPEDPSRIGLSAKQKKEFRLEVEDGQTVVAQYNLSTHARGLLARLPKTCAEFHTTQVLPDNLFVLEGTCQQPAQKSPAKRVIAVNLEMRRLTFASEPLPLEARDFVLAR